LFGSPPGHPAWVNSIAMEIAVSNTVEFLGESVR